MVKRRSRLTRSQDFDVVYRLGRSVANKYLVLYYFPQTGVALESRAARAGRGRRPGGPAERYPAAIARPQSPPGSESARVGVSVSKRLGGAVDRNRLKRALREAYRLNEDRVKTGYDLVLVARAGLPELVEGRGLSGVREKLLEVLEKAALLQSEESTGA